MLPFIRIQTIAAGFRRLGTVSVWVCLFLSLWRAPVPCVHAHGDTAEQNRNAELTAHLARYHAHVGDEDAGWHVHVVSLRDFLRGGGCPVPDDGEQPNPDEMPVVPSLSETRAAFATAAALLPLCFGDVLPVLAAASSTSDVHLGTSDDGEFALPCSRRLPLLCVARC